MTDLERFIELYKSVGIELESYEGCSLRRDELPPLCLEISPDGTAKTRGDEQCVITIVFNADGSFRHQQVYRYD